MNTDLKAVKQQPEKISGGRNSKCKGPEVGMCLTCVFRAQGEKGEMGGEVRGIA